MPACVFSDTYFAYLKSTCGQRNPPKGGLTVDNTAGPFQKQGIVREQRSGEYQFGGEAAKLYEGDWYINVNIKHDLY